MEGENLLCAHGRVGQTQHHFWLLRRILRSKKFLIVFCFCEIRNSATAESEGGQKFLPPNPLPFCPPERPVWRAKRAISFVQKRFGFRQTNALINFKMHTLFLIILSTFLVSLVSFVGVFTLALKNKFLDKILFYLVALSVGGLMGGAFLHLLPEATEKLGSSNVFILSLAGFFLFLIIEKIIHWRHCHKGECPVHAFAYMNLVGDGVHNFIDGLVMAAAFLTGPGIGTASAIAIFLHEIPQEIGDFGVLVYGGFSRKKALFFNFLTALAAVAGGIFGFYLFSLSQIASSFLLPVAAGGFIYIAASDLIPEIRKEPNLKKSALNYLVIFLGILAMYLLKFLEF